MTETRAGKYGRCLAIWIEYTIKTIPKEQRQEYKEIFLKELKTYSLEPRKKGHPINGGSVYELSDLTEIEIRNPRHLARIVKEGLHLMYQKATSARAYNSKIEYLEKRLNFL